MKIKILQENLLRALTRTGRIISTKTQLPVLQNVLLSSEDGMLRVTASNMESSESVLVGVKEEEKGSVCVSAKFFTELVTTLPADTVSLEVKEGVLFVSALRVKASLPTTPASEFPPVSLEINGKAQAINREDFFSALSPVLFAAATDEGRPLLTGVKIRSEASGSLFAATDGYRLSVAKTDINLGEVDMVVPARTLSEVIKLLSEEKETKDVSFGKTKDGQLIFGVGDTRVVSRIIDGEYPDFAKIIPKTNQLSARTNKEELLKAIKSAAIFARDNANIVRLHVSKDLITASANSPQVGQNTVTIDAKCQGDEADIAFNSRFLIDYLSNMNNEEVDFEMTGSLNPGVFKTPDKPGFLHIIMPVRVQV